MQKELIKKTILGTLTVAALLGVGFYNVSDVSIWDAFPHARSTEFTSPGSIFELKNAIALEPPKARHIPLFSGQGPSQDVECKVVGNFAQRGHTVQLKAGEKMMIVARRWYKKELQLYLRGDRGMASVVCENHRFLEKGQDISLRDLKSAFGETFEIATADELNAREIRLTQAHSNRVLASAKVYRHSRSGFAQKF
jgi:hypothetical protein